MNYALRSIRLYFFTICLLSFQNAFAQSEDTTITSEKKIDFNGYLKYLTSVYIVHTPGVQSAISIQNNLIHNRLNFKWYPHKNIRFKTDLRTRVFFGEFIKLSPNYAQTIVTSDSLRNGYKDYLSWAILDREGIAIHAILDRFYFEFIQKKWELRIGRQRINWGINTLWNPNDIFNAYSFTDFDYEERPGADAIRFQYFTGTTSRFEFALAYFDKLENITAAMLYKFNRWNYDFQFISGIYDEDLVFGTGWSGNILNAGFNGEMSYFFSLNDSVSSRHNFLASISLDYIFPNRMYLALGFLYNHSGSVQTSNTSLLSFQLSAKNLYPYRYAISFFYNYPINEIIQLGLTTVYSPSDAHALFISPIFSYTISESWDLSFLAQITFNRDGNNYISALQAMFLRIKFNF